jgi:hypothetical protein
LLPAPARGCACLYDLAGRSDLSGVKKLAWAVLLIVPVVPFLYVLTGGDLW